MSTTHKHSEGKMQLGECDSLEQIMSRRWYYRDNAQFRCASNNACLLYHIQSDPFTDCDGAADEMAAATAADIWDRGMAELAAQGE